MSIVTISLLVAGFVRFFLFASFRMPTGQMENSVLAGEFIGVNQMAYGIKFPGISGNSLTAHYVCSRPAKRNDILLYRHEGAVMIGRCVGLPGDTIEARGFDSYINGERLLQPPNTVLPYQYPLEADTVIAGLIDRLSIARRDSFADGRLMVRYLDRYEHYFLDEALPDSIPLEAYGKEQKDYRISIPEGSYWVLCDNVNLSADSRHVGFVSQEDLIGKAMFVWLSKEPGTPLWKGYRLNRIFTSVY